MQNSLLIFSLLFLSMAVFAKKMDLNTHDLVIAKLENIVKQQSSPKQNWAASARLADLYAERARLKFLAEQEQNCDACLGSAMDRGRALELYKAIVDSAGPQAQEKMILQMAHLERSQGNKKQAEKLLKKASQSNSFSPAVKGQADIALGEEAYRKGDFTKAEKHFHSALNNPQTPNKGFAQYRLAWSQLNQGENQKATDTLVDLLKKPELLSESQSFHQDVARDLATFLARIPVTNENISTLIALSPGSNTKDNLKYLGSECDRLGNRKAASLVWIRYTKEFSTDSVDAIDIQLRTAQANLDEGFTAESLKLYAQVSQSWPNIKCNKDDPRCEEIKIRFKNYVTGWAKSTKNKPSPELTQAYDLYLAAEANDMDTSYHSAQLLMKLKMWDQAAQRFQQTAKLAEAHLNGEKRESAQIIFDGSLLGFIEASEAKEDIKLQIAAYDYYLSQNPSGKSLPFVQYQKAHAIYKSGDYKTAAQLFRDLALTTHDKKIRVQSADLALDCLVLLKQEALMQRWAGEFSKSIPERRSEYAKIARKAVINDSERLLNQPQTNNSTLAESYLRLKAMPIKEASRNEKAAYYKNRMLMAERLKDLDDLQYSAQKYLDLNTKDFADNNYAWSRLAWTAELRLMFYQSYRYTKNIRPTQKQQKEHQLKLALLAELSGNQALPHYQKALSLAGRTQEKNEILVRMIRLQPKPWAQILRNLTQLRKTPTLLAYLALESYGREANTASAKKVLAHRLVRNSKPGQTLLRATQIQEIQAQNNDFKMQPLRKVSERNLAKVLKQRIQHIQAQDHKVKQAVRNKDWTLQVYYIHSYATENIRLYNELMALPAPKGLNSKQLKDYKDYVFVRAEPFKRHYDEAQYYLTQLWEDSAVIERLKQDYISANSSMQKILSREMKLIQHTHSQAKKLTQWLTQQTSPSQQTIDKARLAVRQDPFNSGRLASLESLAKQKGQWTLAGYLNERAKNNEVKEN